tara:strand:+ start:71 stop:217 length:147 start_codon:yes stop_codon:yes gene_type:complete
LRLKLKIIVEMFGQKNKVDCLNDLPSENIAEIDAQKITDISVVRTIAS